MLRSVSNRSLLRCYRQQVGDPSQHRLQEAKWRYSLSSSSSASVPSSSFFAASCSTKQQHNYEPKTERTTTPNIPPLRTQSRCFSLHRFQSSGNEPIISIALRRYHSTTREPSSGNPLSHRLWEDSRRIGTRIQINPLHHVLLCPLRRPPVIFPLQCARHKKKGVRWYTDSTPPGDKKTQSKEETSTVVQDKKQPALDEPVNTDTSDKVAAKGDLSGQSLPPPSDSLAKIREEARVSGARLTALVDSVGPTLKRVSAEWNMGDLLSVYGIVALIGVILAAPMVVRHMRGSDSTYDDLDPEDNVTDLAKIIRDEYYRMSTLLGSSGGGDGEGESSSQHQPGSTLGIDSILADLLKSQQLQDAVTGLVTKVLGSPEFKGACQVLLKQLWNDLIQDPETLAQVIHLLQHALQDERIKEAAIQLVMEIVNDQDVLDELTSLLQRLGKEKQVQSATQALLVESAHNALNDPEILDHSMEFATDVVGDDVVQRTAGEALYNTLSYAVRPTFSVLLSLLGAGLIVLSVAAFRNANAPEAQLDRALSATLSTLESGGIMSIISKLLAIPFQVISACKDAIINVVTFPYRLVLQVIAAVGRACGTTEMALTNVARWIASLPGSIAQSLSSLVARGAQAIMSRLSDRSRRTWEALAASISASMVVMVVRDVAAGMANAHVAMLSAFASLGMAMTRLASTWDQVNNSLNDSALVVETFVLSAIALVTQTGIGYSKRFWDGATSLNVAGVHLSEYLSKILEVLSTSLATITKR